MYDALAMPPKTAHHILPAPSDMASVWVEHEPRGFGCSKEI